MRGGEVIEEAKGEVGVRFSRDNIEVDFMEGCIHKWGVVLSQGGQPFLLSVRRAFFSDIH